MLYMLVASTSDFFYVMTETRRFVVHVCESGDRELADVFAGLRPSPGGPFAAVAATDTEYGPVFDHATAYAFCTLSTTSEESYSTLVSARIDSIRPGEVSDPLIHFLGRYRSLGR